METNNEFLHSKDLLFNTDKLDNVNLDFLDINDDEEIKELLTKYYFYKEERKKTSESITIQKKKIATLKNENFKKMNNYETKKKQIIDIVLSRKNIDEDTKIEFLKRLRELENKVLVENSINKIDYCKMITQLIKKSALSKSIIRNNRLNSSNNHLSMQCSDYNTISQYKTKEDIYNEKEKELTIKTNILKEEEERLENRRRELEEQELKLKQLEIERILQEQKLKRKHKKEKLRLQLQSEVEKESEELKEMGKQLETINIEENSIKDYLVQNPSLFDDQ